MKKNSLKKLSVSESNLNPTDLIESGNMLHATATLLRQSFGIVCMFNDLTPNPMSDSELKAFAQNFDIVHKTCLAYAREITSKGRSLQDKHDSEVS